MIQSRAETLTAVAPQVLGRVALFQLPVTQKPHKMGPTSPGDKRHEQVSQPLFSDSQYIIYKTTLSVLIVAASVHLCCLIGK